MNSVNLNNREAWQENAKLWETYEPPIKPSPGELLIYDLALSTRAAAPYSRKALVLGDSPEVRDLLAQHKFDITAVANNPNAIISMNQLLQYRGDKKERVVIMNWQDMDFAPNAFDVIITDWGLNSLEYWRDYTLVFDRVSRLLKPDGLFLMRINVFKPEQAQRSVAEIMLDFNKKKRHKFSYLLELEMYSNISNYDQGSFQINLGEFYRDKITQAYHNKEMTFSDWQEFYYPFFTVNLTYPNKQSLDELLYRFFTVVAERFGGDYPFSYNEPIYICKQG